MKEKRFLDKFDKLFYYFLLTFLPVLALKQLTNYSNTEYMLIGEVINVVVFIVLKTIQDLNKNLNDRNKNIENFIHNGLVKNFNLLNNIYIPLAIYFETKNIILLAICYIVYDAISIFIEKAIAYTFVAKIKTKERLIDLKDYYEKCQRMYKKLTNYDKCIYNITVEKIKKITEKEKEIDYLKESQETLADNKISVEYEIFESICTKLQNYPYDKNAVPDAEYEILLNKLLKIKELIDKNKEYISIINVTTLETYVDTFIDVLNTFIDIDLEKNNEYKEKLINTVNEFTIYLDKILQKIEEENKSKIDVTCNVLLENIKNEK